MCIRDRFERIHPFQDGNGRVGRLIMFKECLKYNIVPFIIEDLSLIHISDESLANEITEYLQKEIIMDFSGYEERSYSERFTREDGSHIDIAACARKDAPGIVAIYYYTSPEFARNYTLTLSLIHILNLLIFRNITLFPFSD